MRTSSVRKSANVKCSCSLNYSEKCICFIDIQWVKQKILFHRTAANAPNFTQIIIHHYHGLLQFVIKGRS
ncbi:hypothetical protein Trydic_g19480 [Trypoxylus dichotomus]